VKVKGIKDVHISLVQNNFCQNSAVYFAELKIFATLPKILPDER
jgi:hypothetical protein